MSLLASIQFLGLGLLGEVNARIYYGTHPRQNYAIRELINYQPDSLPESAPAGSQRWAA